MFSKKNIENHVLVIFGSNGDLSRRKLLPAIFQLYLDGFLPEKFVILGTGSMEKDEIINRKDVKSALTEFATENVKAHPDKLKALLDQVFYKKVQNKEETDFIGLKEYICTLTNKLDINQNIIYYFSTTFIFFGSINTLKFITFYKINRIVHKF